VFCHTGAHILIDECGAPEFFSGAKLVPVEGEGGKLTPQGLKAALGHFQPGFVHHVQPKMVSLTEATELGTTYKPDEIAAISALAHERGMRVHMDGARFANAVAGSGKSPAELTWKSGVDVLSFGATKNGALAAEAVIFFDKALAETASFRRMRGGHLLSKGRLLSGQFAGWLKDGHWLDLARQANSSARRLARSIKGAGGIRLAWPVDGNEVFAVMPEKLEQRLLKQGFRFYRWRAEAMKPEDRPGKGEVLCRLVCSYQTTAESIDAISEAVRR
jgi:threonine aldolase